MHGLIARMVRLPASSLRGEKIRVPDHAAGLTCHASDGIRPLPFPVRHCCPALSGFGPDDTSRLRSRDRSQPRAAHGSQPGRSISWPATLPRGPVVLRENPDSAATPDRSIVALRRIDSPYGAVRQVRTRNLHWRDRSVVPARIPFPRPRDLPPSAVANNAQANFDRRGSGSPAAAAPTSAPRYIP